MTRFTLTAALITVATTASAHHEHGTHHAADAFGVALVIGLALIGLPYLRRALRK